MCSDPRGLAGRVAVVTGAGRGIGRDIARRLAREGACVAVVDIDGEGATRVAQEIAEAGAMSVAWCTDVTDERAIVEMNHGVTSACGRIDILVNNAGIVQTKSLGEITGEEWDRVMDTNLKSVFLCSRIVGEDMVKTISRGGCAHSEESASNGKIVNLSSISGRRGRPLGAHYAASKAAIISLTQSSALYFAPHNINVNAVSPSVVPTAMWEQIDKDRGRYEGLAPGEAMRAFIERIPLKRAGTGADVAAAVAFLCSSDSDYITGQTINVDGGFEMN